MTQITNVFSNISFSTNKESVDKFVDFLKNKNCLDKYFANERIILVGTRTSALKFIQFVFVYVNGSLVLSNQNVNIKDNELSLMLKSFMEENKGTFLFEEHHKEHILINKIQNGSLSFILKQTKDNNEVIYEFSKDTNITLNDVIKSFESNEIEKEIVSLKLDRECLLINLKYAMEHKLNNDIQIIKEKLKYISYQLMVYED